MTANLHWFRKLLRFGWIGVAMTVIFMAAFIGTIQLVLPVAGKYRANVEQWASRSFDQPVRIGGLGAAWRGFGPRLRLEEVELLDRDGRDVLVRFDEAYIGIDLLRSLRFGELRPGAITIVGIRLTLIRNADGTVSVGGFDTPPPRDGDAGRSQDAMQRWFLHQSRVAIESGEIEWIDRQKHQAPRRFSDVYVRLRNQSGRHRLDGFASLPEDLGRRLQFGLDVTGNFLRADGWRGDLFVQGTALRLPGWLGDTVLLGARVADGSADFKLWSEWSDGKPVHVDGDVSAYNLRLARASGDAGAGKGSASPHVAPANGAVIDAVSGRFTWERRDNGWVAGGERFLLKRQDEIWPPSDFHLAFARYEDGPVLEGAFEFMRLEDVVAMLLASNDLKDNLRDTLTHLEPGGVVRGLQVRYQQNNAAPDNVSVRADVDALTSRPWQKIPGIHGFTGSLESTETVGHLALDTQQASIDFGALFRAALPVNNAQGRVDWRHTNDAWQVQTGLLDVSNDDIATHVAMKMVLPDDRQSPFLDLVVGYENGNGARTSRYLPVAVMPPKAVDWLDRAIVSGDVTSGWMLFHGRLADFPFDDGSGRFEVRFNVHDAILDYAPGWPRLEDVDAEVVFENQGMTVFGRAGKSFASTLDNAQAVIGDFRAPGREVVVTGRAHGPTADALRYLRESPLHEKFGRYLEGAAASGASTLDLELRVPLHPDARARVNATVAFDGSELHIGGDRVAITEINGGLQFTEQGLSGENIKARVLGLPAKIGAATDTTVEPPVTRFSAQGNAGMREFARLADLPQVFDRVSGRTDWQADLNIRPRDQGPADVTLDIRSALQGVDVRLPHPLGKGASTPRELRIALALPQGPEHPVRVSYGDLMRIAYVQRDSGSGLKPDRVAINFGAADAVLTAAPGIYISGELERFALPEWSGIIDKDGPPDGSALKVSGIELGIREATVFDRRFDDVRLSAKRQPTAWLADVTSKQLAGKVQYPLNLSAPLVMDLDYLKLERLGDTKAAEPFDPRKLPVLRVHAGQFSYGSGEWGSLDLTTSRRPDGMHIDEAKLDSATAQVSARGDWVIVKAAHSSSMQIKINTGNLGQTLKNLEYVGGIAGGKGTVELIALWDGPLSAFALEKLDGTLRLNIEDGQILDIEPGAGRLFGLLSVQALPRRLSLDFSDLFKKGFSFDKMAGAFSIDSGNAYTDDFYVEGPAARVETRGRVGLANRDYDQLVTMTPHVSSGLPVAGVLAGGPVVGAAMLLAERIFKPGIEEIVTIQYSVTGSWSNPTVERVPKPGQTGRR